jgi:hypothetical protein
VLLPPPLLVGEVAEAGTSEEEEEEFTGGMSDEEASFIVVGANGLASRAERLLLALGLPPVLLSPPKEDEGAA